MSKEIFNKIIAKLERLDEYLRYLADIQKINKKDFLSNYHFYGLAERYLQLAIEVLIDVGKLVIIECDFRKPQDNQDIFAVLAERKVISKNLLEQMAGIANFRNILVHEYEKINRAIIYDRLQNNLRDFKEYKKSVLRYLNKKSQ